MQRDVSEPEDADGEGVEGGGLLDEHVAQRVHDRVGEAEGEAEEWPCMGEGTSMLLTERGSIVILLPQFRLVIIH